MTRRGISIRIYLADGEPEGVRLVEKSNWTGHALVCPRSRFGEVKSRDEFSRPGVYVLVGPSDTPDSPRIYIGEGDPVRPRLEQHQRDKDFWTIVVLFTSSSNSLNKAHVQFLEARLVGLARATKRSELVNGNMPQLPNLSEADQAEMEAFLEDMLLVYPIVGLTAFETPRTDVPKLPRLSIRSKGIVAHGYDTPSGLVVKAGSSAVSEWVPSSRRGAIELREALVLRGVIVSDSGTLRFTQDYTFDSPSTAAEIVLGRTANGRIEWKDDSGRTLREIQEPPPDSL